MPILDAIDYLLDKGQDAWLWLKAKWASFQTWLKGHFA